MNRSPVNSIVQLTMIYKYVADFLNWIEYISKLGETGEGRRQFKKTCISFLENKMRNVLKCKNMCFVIISFYFEFFLSFGPS